MLRTKPDGNGGFDENSYRSADEVNAIRWENLSKPEHSKTIDYYRGLIAFRKAHSALRSQYRKDVFNSVQMIPFRNQHVVLFRVQDEEKEIFLIFNASSEAVSVALPAGIIFAITISFGNVLHLSKDSACSKVVYFVPVFLHSKAPILFS